MFDDKKGPIEHFSWGKFVVCGKEHGKEDDKKEGCGKDIRIIGKKVTEWKERKGHLLDKSMITGVFEDNIKVLVIGTGVNEQIVCPDKVKEFITSKGINEIILKSTPEACRIYNNLYNKGEKVAMLAHGTC